MYDCFLINIVRPSKDNFDNYIFKMHFKSYIGYLKL